MQVIDTAGIRRKSEWQINWKDFRVSAFRFYLEESDVSILVINAEDGATDGEDCGIMPFELRKPILIVVNKWDLIKDKNI